MKSSLVVAIFAAVALASLQGCGSSPAPQPTTARNWSQNMLAAGDIDFQMGASDVAHATKSASGNDLRPELSTKGNLPHLQKAKAAPSEPMAAVFTR